MPNIGGFHASPVSLVGLGAALLLSAAASATGLASGAEALLIGLAAGTATLVLDGTARAERRFRLRRLVESADWLPSAVLSVATATRDIVDQYAEREILAEARRLLGQTTDAFAELAQGRITRPASDYELLLTGIDACHRRVDAVTNVPAGTDALRWWHGQVGRRYWRANLKALSRGVTITRIFVCHRLDDELAALIAEQREAGVAVLVALRAQPDPTPPTHLVIWDGRRGWETRESGDEGPGSNVFTVNEIDVRRLSDTFAAWTEAGRVIEM